MSDYFYCFDYLMAKAAGLEEQEVWNHISKYLMYIANEENQ